MVLSVAIYAPAHKILACMYLLYTKGASFARGMKKERIFKGAATALITPFKDGEIDYRALGDIIEEQINGGVSALVVGGTTGEAATLTDEERYTLFAFTRERVAGRVKLIFGTGTNDTKVALAHTRVACKIGCDGVLVVTPYYNKGTDSGIVKHYLQIAEASTAPVLLYNVPGRTGVNLSFGVLDKLVEHPNIVGIKEASDSHDRLISLRTYGENLDLYAGNDSAIYTALSLGGAGVISVMSNALPRTLCRICELYFSGRHEESLALQVRALPFIRAIFCETNPAPIKHVMQTLGYCTGELRLPLCEVGAASRDIIDRALAEIYLEEK